jgi:hypothetical protein
LFQSGRKWDFGCFPAAFPGCCASFIDAKQSQPFCFLHSTMQSLEERQAIYKYNEVEFNRMMFWQNADLLDPIFNLFAAPANQNVTMTATFLVRRILSHRLNATTVPLQSP